MTWCGAFCQSPGLPCLPQVRRLWDPGPVSGELNIANYFHAMLANARTPSLACVYVSL